MPLHDLSQLQPDMFSRDTLEETFRHLRKTHPKLALDVQNQMQRSHILAGSPFVDSDYFMVDLEADVIGKIINALTRLGEHHLRRSPTPKVQLRQIRTLMQEWITLAEWIVANATLYE